MTEKTYREALTDALFLEMRRDENVFVMGEDVVGGTGSPHAEPGFVGGVFGVTGGLHEEFGLDRCIDMPISEAGIAGTAAGAALAGKRPVAEIMFCDFMGLCLDQLMNQAAKFRYMVGGKATCPMVLRTTYGAGMNAASQHSQSLHPLVTAIPGLKVAMPSTPADAKGLLSTAIRDDDPVIFMESELMYGEKGNVPEQEYLIPIGKSNLVHEGNDVTLVSFGKMMKVAEETFNIAKKENISVEVIDLRSVRPIDYESIVKSVKKTNRLVVIEEAWPLASISSEISHHIQRFAFDYLDAPVHRITCEDVPFHYAPTLIKEILPSVEKAMKAIKSVTYKKN